MAAAVAETLGDERRGGWSGTAWRAHGLLIALCLGVAPMPALALEQGGLAPPANDAVLVVSGAIERTTDGVAALFDVAMLEALAGHDPSTAGPCLVSLEAILAFVGAHGDHVEFRTLDDRRASVSIVAGTGDLVLVVGRGGPSSPDKTTIALGTVDAEGRVNPGATLDRVVRIRIE